MKCLIPRLALGYIPFGLEYSFIPEFILINVLLKYFI